MKKLLLALAVMLIGAAATGTISSCGGNSGTTPIQKKEGKIAKPEKRDTANLPNYRYVDSDTLLAKYNLAKDYQEEMLRLQSSIENIQRQRANAIQQFANQIQTKMQNNQYTEATYNADMTKLTQMQNSAEEEIGKMQMNAQNQIAQAQQVVNDSILNFVERYNASKGYDAILMKAATLYINPAMDITDEILEGLNKSYNNK